jgi:DNA-directed RNA polymerase specialized sigma24 family protein
LHLGKKTSDQPILSEDNYWLRKLATQTDATNRLLQATLAVLLKQQDLNTTDKILLLYSTGLRPTQIAEILGTTQNSVNVILSKQRKQSERNAAKSSKSRK